jgi:hypothetical protein
MNANELRLGNYLSFTGTPHQIGLEFFQWIKNFKEDFKNDNDTGIEPIAITKEWLINAGFKESGYFFSLSGFYHQTIAISITLEKTLFGDNEEYEIKHLKYVHQLQNLYFSITGEELIFSSTEP